MSDSEVCKVCGVGLLENEDGVLVHNGGGRDIQVCKNGHCGWKGGQYSGFMSCPSCGDSSSLVLDHSAQ